MFYRRWILCLIDIFAYAVTVYSEVSIIFNLYSMMGKGYFDTYNLGLMEIESFIMVAGVFLDQTIRMLTDKIDSLEEKGESLWK